MSTAPPDSEKPDSANDSNAIDADGTIGDARPRSPRWAWAFLLIAVGLMGVGGALQLFAMMGGDAEPVASVSTGSGGESGGGGSSDLIRGFAPVGDEGPMDGGEGGDGEAAVGAVEGDDGSLSPAIFRLGFSFVVGFAIAYALRAFLKITLVVGGILILALFGLQYAGVVDVNWAAMEEHYDHFAGWAQEQTASFGAFIKGYLPSAGLFTLGLVAGFRRR